MTEDANSEKRQNIRKYFLFCKYPHADEIERNGKKIAMNFDDQVGEYDKTNIYDRSVF